MDSNIAELYTVETFLLLLVKLGVQHVVCHNSCIQFVIEFTVKKINYFIFGDASSSNDHKRGIT